jgi:23S rRNA (cytosine1962-C5)-methyltransferase
VEDHEGRFLAWGHFSPHSEIRVRLLEWHADRSVNERWYRERLERAVAMREALAERIDSDCLRIVHAEADGLPGLVVDRYGDYLVMQCLTVGMERVKKTLVDLLAERLHPAGIYERSDVDLRRHEGLEKARGIRFGSMPPERILLREGGRIFQMDLREGQKTGFYLDQRDNRRAVARYAEGKTVLDVFSYTGAFAAWALAGGAEKVTVVESSRNALPLLQANLEAAAEGSDRVEIVTGNAFEILRRFRTQGRRFDLVILDPPKLARTKSQLERALRAYKDANLQALRLVAPGGWLATFSCSQAVTAEILTQVISWAARDAEREVRIVQRFGQAPDHPIRPSFPESGYLKGFLCRVD